MLSIALYLGLFVHSQLPNFITEGMAREQVEAILGEKTGTVDFSGGIGAGSSWTKLYFDSGLTIAYQDGKVVSIARHRK